MTEEQKPKPKRRWLRRTFRTLMTLVIVLGVAAAIGFAVLKAGWFDDWIREAVVQRIAQVTGGKVELNRFHLALFDLRVELTGLTVHGREPEGTPPLFHADSLITAIQVDSLWHKKISLKELRIV